MEETPEIKFVRSVSYQSGHYSYDELYEKMISTGLLEDNKFNYYFTGRRILKKGFRIPLHAENSNINSHYVEIDFGKHGKEYSPSLHRRVRV